jgi:26S proteasome regulatory subunit N2
MILAEKVCRPLFQVVHPLVPQFWAEISEHIALMFVHFVSVPLLTIKKNLFLFSKALYKSNDLSKNAQDSATLLASKVYYFLGEYDEALSFAPSAGNMFEVESCTYGTEDYIETVVCEWYLTDIVALKKLTFLCSQGY